MLKYDNALLLVNKARDVLGASQIDDFEVGERWFADSDPLSKAFKAPRIVRMDVNILAFSYGLFITGGPRAERVARKIAEAWGTKCYYRYRWLRKEYGWHVQYPKAIKRFVRRFDAKAFPFLIYNPKDTETSRL